MLARRMFAGSFAILVSSAAAFQFHLQAWPGWIIMAAVTAWIAVDPMSFFRSVPVAVRQFKYNLAATGPVIAREGWRLLCTIAMLLGSGAKVLGLYLLPTMTAASWLAGTYFLFSFLNHTPLLVGMTVEQWLSPLVMMSLMCGYVLMSFFHSGPFGCSWQRYKAGCVRTALLANPLSVAGSILYYLGYALVRVPKMVTAVAYFVGHFLRNLYRLTHSSLRLAATIDGVIGMTVFLCWQQPLLGLVVGEAFCLFDHFVLSRILLKPKAITAPRS